MDLCSDQAPSPAFSPINRDNPLNRDTLNRDTTVLYVSLYFFKEKQNVLALKANYFFVNDQSTLHSFNSVFYKKLLIAPNIHEGS